MFLNLQPAAITTQTVYTAYLVFVMSWQTFVKDVSVKITRQKYTECIITKQWDPGTNLPFALIKQVQLSGVYLNPGQKGQHSPVHYSWWTEREREHWAMSQGASPLLHFWPTSTLQYVFLCKPTRSNHSFNSSRITAACGNAGRTLADPTLPPPGL